MSPTPRPFHRTKVTRADNIYPLGQQAVAVRVEAGVVLAVDDDEDTCTVEMFGEDIDGVVILGDPPDIDDVVEVWESDDLLWTPGVSGWVDPFTDPTTDLGDLMVRGSTDLERLAVGADGDVL